MRNCRREENIKERNNKGKSIHIFGLFKYRCGHAASSMRSCRIDAVMQHRYLASLENWNFSHCNSKRGCPYSCKDCFMPSPCFKGEIQSSSGTFMKSFSSCLVFHGAWLWCFAGQAGREVTDDGSSIPPSHWNFVFGVLSSAVGPFRARLTS